MADPVFSIHELAAVGETSNEDQVSSDKDVAADNQPTPTNIQLILDTNEAAGHGYLENKDLLEMIKTQIVAPLSANIAELREQLQDLAQKLTVTHKSGVSQLHVPADNELELSQVTLPDGDVYKLLVNEATADKIRRPKTTRSVIRDILLHVYNHDIKALGLLFRSFKNGGNERYDGAALFPEPLEKAILAFMRDTWYPQYSPEKVIWNTTLDKSRQDTNHRNNRNSVDQLQNSCKNRWLASNNGTIIREPIGESSQEPIWWSKARILR